MTFTISCTYFSRQIGTTFERFDLLLVANHGSILPDLPIHQNIFLVTWQYDIWVIVERIFFTVEQ
ncbi:hypothetical protein ES703_119986 [subsurface metagenome]